jgi:pimeloyl-ACP methyl ester carboxylesterase
MPIAELRGTRLYYEEYGQGFPLLLFAPGGMRSSIAFWARSPWNPIEALSDQFRVIAMDQRNAGHSTAPIHSSNGWHSYAADHIALMDQLGIERAHVLGGCIGGPYCLGVMQAAPARVTAAVLQQPIGYDGENRQAFYEMFDSWANELKPQRNDVDPDAWNTFRDRMYGGDFVFNVSREFVRQCRTPMLVLLGNDRYHPSVTSREIVELAPNAELVERWKEPEVVEQTVARVRAFLASHTPQDTSRDSR